MRGPASRNPGRLLSILMTVGDKQISHSSCQTVDLSRRHVEFCKVPTNGKVTCGMGGVMLTTYGVLRGDMGWLKELGDVLFGQQVWIAKICISSFKIGVEMQKWHVVELNNFVSLIYHTCLPNYVWLHGEMGQLKDDTRGKYLRVTLEMGIFNSKTMLDQIAKIVILRFIITMKMQKL